MIPNKTISLLKPKKVGPWSIDHFEVSEDKAKMGNLHDIMHGYGERCVDPGLYTRLAHAQRGCVMSNTKAEMRDMYGFFYQLDKYRESVLPVHIDGLGLGIAAIEALERGYYVEVVEIDMDVIQLVGQQLTEHYPIDKLQIIHANALEFKPTMHYSVVWHDIWDTICSDNWDQYIVLHRKYGHRCLWQGSWARDYIVREKRQERNSIWRW
jgi:hypothetical protein